MHITNQTPPINNKINNNSFHIIIRKIILINRPKITILLHKHMKLFNNINNIMIMRNRRIEIL